MDAESLSTALSAADDLARALMERGVGRRGLAPDATIRHMVDIEAARAFDRDAARPWMAACGFPQATPDERLARGLLYAGIAGRLLPPEERTPDGAFVPFERMHAGYWAGAKAQHLLHDGLLGASPDGRTAFAAAVDALPEEHAPMRRHVAGALAGARAYHALRACGLPLNVRIGTLSEDVLRATDIVATRRGREGGCVVQVKANGRHSRAQVLPERQRPFFLSRLFDARWDEERRTDALRGAERVWEEAYRRGRRWAALLVYADVATRPPAELDDPELRDLLRARLLETPIFSPDEPTGEIIP